MPTMRITPPADRRSTTMSTPRATCSIHVHLQDTDGHADRHWAPGEGYIPLGRGVSGAWPDQRQPRLILELRDKEKVRAGADHLIRLGLAQ